MTNENYSGNTLGDISSVQDAHATDESTIEYSVLEVIGAYRPGPFGQQLKAATQTGSTTCVIVPNEHIAAAVHEFTKAPMKDLTDNGAAPYRTLAPLRTSAGDRVVREASTSPDTVELLATGEVELTVGPEILRVSGGEAPIDADTDLPDGVFLAKDVAGTDEIELTRGDGTTVTTLTSEAELETSYPPIKGWFRPDRLSYRGDITILYSDPADGDRLCIYDYPPQDPTAATPAMLTAFLEQFSVSAEGSQLESTDVCNRYRAWLNAGQTTPSRSEFYNTLHNMEWIETTSETSGSTMILDRAWRFPVTYER